MVMSIISKFKFMRIRDSDSLLSATLKVVPICFTVGAAIELFMIKTGFYTIVTRKESERLTERFYQEQIQIQRLKELGIDFDRKEK